MIQSMFLPAPARRELEAYVRIQRKDQGIARRGNVIVFLDDRNSCHANAKFLYLNKDIIRGWYKTYRISGCGALSTNGPKGGRSRRTMPQEAELWVSSDGRFYRPTVAIRTYIASQFATDYSYSGCIKMLGRLGFESRKHKALQGVASADSQANFIVMYQHSMTKLGADAPIYFANALHCEYQTKPPHGWYNSEHQHSPIRFVIRDTRHPNDDHATTANRAIVYANANAQNPQCWSGKTRDRQPAGPVWIKPEGAITASEIRGAT